MTTTLHRLPRWPLAQRLILVATVSIALVSLTATSAWSAVSAEQQGAAGKLLMSFHVAVHKRIILNYIAFIKLTKKEEL